MKTILVPVEKNDTIAATLATTCLLAKRFASYVEGFALTPELNALMATEGLGSIVLYPADLAQQDPGTAEGIAAIVRERHARAWCRRFSRRTSPRLCLERPLTRRQ